MPVAGRKPKPQGEARNRVKPTHDWTEVEDVPHKGGPALPKRDSGEPWPASVKRWWDKVRAMPHAALWTPAEWEFGFMAAETRALFVETSRGTYLSEMLRHEKVLGTTADFRRDLRIRYVPPVEDVGGDSEVTNLNDYRDL